MFDFLSNDQIRVDLNNLSVPVMEDKVFELWDAMSLHHIPEDQEGEEGYWSGLVEKLWSDYPMQYFLSTPCDKDEEMKQRIEAYSAEMTENINRVSDIERETALTILFDLRGEVMGLSD